MRTVRTASEILARGHQRAMDARARIALGKPISVQGELREQDQLPLFLRGLTESNRAMPNHVARSSLFAPVARGRRKLHDQAVLVSRADAKITYTGRQLDETQADAWLQLLYTAKEAPLGRPVTMHRAAFLRAMGRGTSGREYKWLHRTMFDFTAATIVIEARRADVCKYLIGDTKAFHMLSDFSFDAESETYSFTIDPRWKTLFGGGEYALIDWEKRLLIAPGQDMAKALQRLAATTSDPGMSEFLCSRR